MKLLITGKTLGGGLILNIHSRFLQQTFIPLHCILTRKKKMFLSCLFVDIHVTLEYFKFLLVGNDCLLRGWLQFWSLV